MSSKAIRSPLFYVGDKYKLMPQLVQLFPEYIDTYIEPFVGGGSSFLNTNANRYVVNDIDKNIIAIHEFLKSYAFKENSLYEEIYRIVDKYKLSCSYRGIVCPEELKKQYVKTYYSHYNKAAYTRLKNDYNKHKDTSLLYVLLIYGFNHMIRFNSSGVFNLPVGNVDYNKNVHAALKSYLEFVREHDIEFYNSDYLEFVNSLQIGAKDFVYLDPPYLISDSEYNKLWNEAEETRLLTFLDGLNDKGILFGITNLVNHKGNTNRLFIEWSKKYRVYEISSNYISFNDNTIKENSKEVYVTNAKRKI